MLSTEEEALKDFYMHMLAAISESLEKIVGPGSRALLYASGKEYGEKLTKSVEKTSNLKDAINKLLEVFHWVWEIEVKDEEQIVVRKCPIRTLCQRLNIERGEKGMLLCHYVDGIFAGVLSGILDKTIEVKIIKSAPTACMKNLLIKD